MADRPPSGNPLQQAARELRLLRLKEGEHVICWVTHHIEGGKIKGLFTRHTEVGSIVIPPELRHERVKGKVGVWKGYISAVVWEKAEKAWIPYVVEVTERCEQDFRGKVQRGQVWKLWKAPKEKGKKIPLRATFLENRPHEATPSAFDVGPKLRNHIFRSDDVDLSFENPLPDLVVVAPVLAPAPGEKMETPKENTGRATIRFSERFGSKPNAISEVLNELNGELASKGGDK